MYESTVDVLYNLYDKLAIGGYVIIDDWFGFPARTACEDFFEVESAWDIPRNYSSGQVCHLLGKNGTC